MWRRKILIGVGAGVLAAPFSCLAQQRTRLRRIGMLLSGVPAADDSRIAALRQALRDHGYVEGQSIVIEPRWSDRIPQLSELATELVRSKVDLIVTQGSPAAQAVQRASGTMPIVMATSGDPVKIGLVASLAHPGGSITGLTVLSDELSAKRLQILKEIVPGARRIAVLWNPANPGVVLQMRATENAASATGVALQGLSVRDPDEIEGAFRAARGGRAEALLVLDDPLFTARRGQIAKLAAANRLPALYGLSTSPAAEELVNYGPNLLEMFRRAGVYVDKILKGAKPADLPVEQPIRFELVVNVKTAKALGLTIPPSILVRADRVIE